MTEPVQAAVAEDSFPFLTSERANLIRDAIQTYRREFLAYILQNSEVYAAMTRRIQSSVRRGYLVSAFKRTVGSLESVAIREDNGGFFLVFDQESVLDLKKVDPKTFLAWRPKALQPIDGPRNLPLEGFINEENVPLNELRDFVAAFVEDRFGQLAGFYLTEQNDDEVVSRLPFEVSQALPMPQLSPNDAHPIPEVKFKARKRPVDNEGTGL